MPFDFELISLLGRCHPLTRTPQRLAVHNQTSANEEEDWCLVTPAQIASPMGWRWFQNKTCFHPFDCFFDSQISDLKENVVYSNQKIENISDGSKQSFEKIFELKENYICVIQSFALNHLRFDKLRFESITKNKSQPTLFLFSPVCVPSKLIAWQSFYNHRLCFGLREVGLPEHKFQPSKTHLIRPLITLHRRDIKKLCFFWMLPFCPDKTNQQLTFQRNRVRNQLLPSLKHFLNPQLEKALFQLSEILASEHRFVECFTTQFWSQAGNIEYIKPSLLLALPPPLSRRMVKRGFQQKTTRRTSFLMIESLLIRTLEQIMKNCRGFLFSNNTNKGLTTDIRSVDIDQLYLLFYPKQGAIVEFVRKKTARKSKRS
uniref:Hypothetical chloroplast RF62 n=1 Tax=Xylochloris irregularis TaxID=480381 RepID=A0A097KME8_9CHLO|nr:hypothetical chloroplast RF62 [Xylochloris irregularis]AIT94359.1 hypothetical chloroplast RF62 [Xylochloris irregularis]